MVSVAEESIYGEQLPYRVIASRMENREYSTIFDSDDTDFFRARWFKIDILEFVDKRETGPGAGSYV